MMLKIDLTQLKKAIQWIEANTNEVAVQIYTGDSNKLILRSIDRLGSEVEITLYNDSTMLPKIKKTEILG
jgi:hypothetical protein